MKTSKFTDSQIISILMQAESGTSVATLYREHNMSNVTFYKWLKAIQPLCNNPDEHELLEAKKEILQLEQIEEERNILKKATRYFASLPE